MGQKQWITVIVTAVITALIVGFSVYFWQNQETQITPVQQVETEQNVKTYNSSEFQYSFQYPQEWFLTKGPTTEYQPEVIFVSKEELLEGSDPDTELSVTINRSSLEDNVRENLISREGVSFAGQAATKIKFTGDFGPLATSILVQRDGHVLVISYDSDDEDDAKIKSILDSFSFIDCSDLGSTWTLFSDEETTLSFCYKKSWGSTKLKESGISPEAKTGTIYYVSFTKSVNNYPLVSYSTPDFLKLGDSDTPMVIDWQALDFSKSDSELVKLFRGENATVQKLTVNGKQVLKVHRDFVEPLSQERITPVDYFMPNVTINGETYNLHIIGSLEQESDMDLMLDSIRF